MTGEIGDQPDSGSRPLCAFGPCTCPVEKEGDFCAPTCRFGLGARGEPCKCGHGECKVTTGEG
jgi:hypothetical protein